MKRRVLVILETALRPGRAQLVGIFRRVNEARLDWNVRIVQSRKEMSAAVLDRVRRRSVDGVIIAIPGGRGVPERLVRSKIPVVFMDVLAPAVPTDVRTAAFLRVDDAAIGLAGARHFISLGNFRSFAFVHDARAEIWTEERGNSFTSALSEKRKCCAVFRTQPETPRPKRLRALAGFLASLPSPAAVMAACDLVAAEVLEACRTSEFDVPERIAVLGVDNDEALCTRLSPRLSSIEPDFEEEGYRAAGTLAAMFGELDNETPPTISAARLIDRESAKTVPPATRLVERALEFIDRNFREPISVADVIRHLGVSRRLADLRFRQLQDETILETLTRRRLEELRRRLRGSTTPLNRIVRDCGFGSSIHAAHLFKARYGMSMSVYRAGG